MQEKSCSPETRDEKLRRLDYYIEKNREHFIKDNFPTLLRKIQSKYTLLPKLVSRRVIDDVEMEDIQSEKTEYKQNEQLIKVIKKSSKENYLTFLEVLAERQEDLVQLLTGGEWHKKRASKAASLRHRPDLDFTIQDRTISRDQWKNCLNNNRRELVDSIQVDSLLDGCLSNGILSDRDVAAVKVEKTVYDRAGKLCDVLLRIDSAYYIQFLSLLCECQPSIARDLAQSLNVL